MLSLDEAYLWHVSPQRLAAASLGRCLTLLGPDERARYYRIRRPEGRLTYLVARALVRCALSVHRDVPPAAWEFRRAPGGRPEVAAPAAGADLHFSLSHTSGLATCLIARVDVGVDAESRARRLPVLALARRFLSPEEARNLRDVPSPRRHERFLQLWTLKEAYLKARGLGLAGGLDALGVSIRDGEPLETCTTDDEPRRWQLGLRYVTDAHVVAFAIHDPGLRVRTCPAEQIMTRCVP